MTMTALRAAKWSLTWLPRALPAEVSTNCFSRASWATGTRWMSPFFSRVVRTLLMVDRRSLKHTSRSRW